MGSISILSPEEVAALADGDLDAALVEMERARRLVESAIVDVLDAADRRRRYVADGHVSVRGWAQALTNCSRAETMRRLQTMRALRDLESLRAALRAGEVGVDQVRELARVHANPRCASQLPESEEALLGHARRLDFDEFRIVVRRWETLADADGAHRVTNKRMNDATRTWSSSTVGITSKVTAGQRRGLRCRRSSSGSVTRSSHLTGRRCVNASATPPAPR